MYAITCIVFSFSSQQLDAFTYKSLNLSLYMEIWCDTVQTTFIFTPSLYVITVMQNFIVLFLKTAAKSPVSFPPSSHCLLIILHATCIKQIIE